jgi:PAT family acetyl-CoA transporter-like MFS transporter 1
MITFLVLDDISITSNFVIMAGFYNRVSDPLLGGTYITTLASLSNFGSTFTNWLAVKLINAFDY